MVIDSICAVAFSAAVLMASVSSGIALILIAGLIYMLAKGHIRIEDYSGEDGGTRARINGETTAQRTIRKRGDVR